MSRPSKARIPTKAPSLSSSLPIPLVPVHRRQVTVFALHEQVQILPPVPRQLFLRNEIALPKSGMIGRDQIPELHLDEPLANQFVHREALFRREANACSNSFFVAVGRPQTYSPAICRFLGPLLIKIFFGPLCQTRRRTNPFAMGCKAPIRLVTTPSGPRKQ